MKHPGIASLNGDAAIDQAIATLVLAFSTGPVAHWMYSAPVSTLA